MLRARPRRVHAADGHAAQGHPDPVRDRRQAEPARDAAVARPQADRTTSSSRRTVPRSAGMIDTVTHLRRRSRRSTAGETLKVHHLRPAPGAHTRQDPRRSRRGLARARPPVAAPRAPRPATRSRPRFEGGQMPLHMRLPKLKGFKNRFRTEYQVVNLDRLGRAVPARAAPIGVDELVAAGLVRKGQPGQGARRRRPVGGAAGHRAHVLRLRRARRSPRPAGRSPSCSEALAVAAARAAATRQAGDRPRQAVGHTVMQRPSARPRRPARRAPGPDPGQPGGRVLTAFDRAFKTPDLRKKLLFTLASSRSTGSARSCRRPASTTSRIQRRARARRGRQRRLRPGQPVQRRRAAPAGGLRARDHAVHHGSHHHAAADRGDPAPGAAQEGGRVRATRRSRSTPAT